MSGRVVIALVLLLWLTIGCSELEVFDAYIPDASTGKEGQIHIESGDAFVSLYFEPKTRFASMGVLGVPAIPGQINGKKQTELSLIVSLQMRTPRTFDLAMRPCLTVSPTESLCPTDLSAKALAMSDATGLDIGGHIGQFYNSGVPLVLGDLAATDPSQRLADSYIYSHYFYKGIPPWNWMSVTVRYRYACAGECPDRFTLSLDGLVNIEDRLHSHGQHLYLRKRVKDYRPMEAVQ